MSNSRMSRIEEKRIKKQLFLVVAGIIITIILVVIFGIPLLVKTSVFLGDLKSGPNINISQDKTPPYPPTLFQINEATNTARIKIEGYAESESTVKLFLNNEEIKKTLLGKDGTFSYEDIDLKDGVNEIYALAMDTAGNESVPSQILTVNYLRNAPKLIISEPGDNQNFGKNQQEISIKGQTDPGNSVSINSRFVYVKDDGMFVFTLKLSDGDNLITITAKDAAGNETKKEMHVVYSP